MMLSNSVDTGSLIEAWTEGKPLPHVPPGTGVVPRRAATASESEAEEDTAAAASSSASRRTIMKKPARADYERPRNPNGTAINTETPAAIAIKRSAALALGVFLDNIRTTHAYDSALVNIDVDLGAVAITADWTPTEDWSWLLYVAVLAYIVVLHTIVLYFVGGGIWTRVRARFTIRRRNAATQCTLLPDITLTTVEGLRSELRSRGLKTTGLRAELEVRLSQAVVESDQ